MASNEYLKYESQIYAHLSLTLADIGWTLKRECFQDKMNRHISKNFRYPEIAQKKGIQGRVIIQFVVGKDGNVSGIKTRGPDPILEKEAVRIISLLPKIKPAEIEGRKVRAPFSTSITFKLY